MLEISNTTKQSFSLSKEILEQIKNDILDTSYDVSIVVVGDKKARALNQEYRGKDYIPNVLSFPIDETMGEIFINPKTASLEASKFDLSVNHYFYYLLIHSMLHLKGFNHGDQMSLKESFYMKKYFNIEINF